MRTYVGLLFILLHAASAITGPRGDGQLDRRRQISITQSPFAEGLHRFGNQNFHNGPSFSPQQTSPGLFQQQSFQPSIQQTLLTPPQSTLISGQNHDGHSSTIPHNSFLQSSNQQQLNNQEFQNVALPSQNVGLPTQIFSNIPDQSALVHQQQISQVQNTHQNGLSNNFLPTLTTQQAHLNPNFNQNLQAISGNHIPTTLINTNPLLTSANNQFSQINSQLSFQNGNIFSNEEQNANFQKLLEQQKKENLEKLKELQERQRIIQKHKEFLERQQQKQQEKVNKLHEEFLAKQSKKPDQVFLTTTDYDELIRSTISHQQRNILPHETNLFHKAIKMYENSHPTPTTPSTTTTTESSTKEYKPRTKSKIKNRPENRQKLYNDIKSLIEESDTKGLDEKKYEKSLSLLQKPDLLKQLRLAIAEQPDDLNEKNFSTREISLPNGKKIELIKTTDPNLIPKGALTADSSSLIQETQPQFSINQKNSFEEITRDVLPPGTDYELIKQSETGRLEELQKLPVNLNNKKKVTFVFLEEQEDGSYKVKGVKGNGQSKDEVAPDVDGIINKIKNGEIQLPSTTAPKSATITTTVSPSTIYESSSFLPTHYHSSSSATSKYYSSTVSPYTKSFTPRSTKYNNLNVKFPRGPTTTKLERSSAVQKTSPINTFATRPASTVTASSINPTVTPYIQDGSTVDGSSGRAINSKSNPDYADSQISYATHSSPGLIEILKENGLFATAKYLKQSGLDSVLNETGPYTIFSPTDKAFRTLLVQLGGPDKAEEKFKDNPRLLSGLLLHHVIPGAFDIASLQDEMTGVSLAGTQLRVNQYDMHDVEWNEIKVTTINGARVLEEKKDINIPQGIAHAVDRVMFPLPVGDLVQTMQADRDHRFTHFLRALHVAGYTDTLTGSKTFTVFAPTDAAFERLSSAERARLGERAPARALVARHLAPATLYSAGMRYYQLRDSVEEGKPITLQKNSGRIKVNNAQVVTHNIPATNGVIHAIDTLL